MTNKEWLDYLAHNAPDELAAWFDAEHVEHQERVLDGDTEPEKTDSRDKLEADAERYIEHAADYAYEDTLWADETFTLYDAIIELLDRQAAITEREVCAWIRGKDAEHDERIHRVAELQQQVDELTAERDELQERLNRTTAAMNRAAGKWAKTDAELRNALDIMRIWISDDAHLGESAISYEFEKAEGLRKLESIKQSITVTIGGLEAERDNLKANNEQLHTLAGEQAAKIDELQSALNAICANLSIIATGEPSVIADIAIETIDALIDECNTANRQCKVYRLKFGKCLDYADAIHALMDDEGVA